MKNKYLAMTVLLLLTTLAACRSFQNEGGPDWATVEFSVNDSNHSSARYSAAESILKRL